MSETLNKSYVNVGEPLLPAGKMFFTIQPHNFTISGPGQEVTFRGVAVGAFGYLWAWRPAPDAEWAVIDGEVTDTFTTTISAGMNGWQFICVAFDAEDNYLESRIATISCVGLTDVTQTGTLVTIEYGPVSIKSAFLNIIPVQDLNGQDHPYAPGEGINQLPPFELRTLSADGINFSSDGKGKYTLSGKALVSTYVTYYTSPRASYTVPSADDYKLVFMNPTADSNVKVSLRDRTVSPQIVIGEWILDVPYKEITDISAIAGKSYDTIRTDALTADVTYDMSLEPMFVPKTMTPSEYIPYSNICPITGWSEGDFVISPSDLVGDENARSYEIEFGSTVYGGRLNLSSGDLTITNGYIASYNNETLPGTWISDRDAYAPNTTPTIGAEVVYELETPLTSQLTLDIDFTTSYGSNYISTDCGTVEITYVDWPI